MEQAERPYLPAAGRDWLLPFYDPLSKLIGAGALHRRLIDQADIHPGQRVLEIGCGTGSMTTLVKARHPGVDVVGLDPDPKALDRARHKAARQRVSIVVELGFSDELPYPDRSFDRVLSSLMLHHLQRDEKLRTLQEVRRVLKPGGSLHVVDLGESHDHADGFLARLLHRSEHLRDNSPDALLAFMREAGLAEPAVVGHQRKIFGHVVYYRTSSPASAPGERR